MSLSSLKKQWIHLVAILSFFLACCVFFFPQFQGKKMTNSGDLRQWKGMVQELKEHKEKTGDDALWTNSMFGGMPAYYISLPGSSNLTGHIRDGLSLWLPSPAGRFMMGMLSFYILMLVLRVHPIIGIFGAILFSFSTNNLVLLNAGHVTKISTLMNAPLIIAGVIAAYRGRYLLGLVTFGIGMAINLRSDHPQMTYYLGLVMVIYVLIEFIKSIRSGQLAHFAKASGYMVVGLLLALGSFSNKMLPTLEYSADTMRGKPILTQSNSGDSSSKVEGLAWDYAMRWSNGWIDLFPSFIPHFVGGSSGEHVSSKSGFAKELRRRGMNTRNGVQAPTYWGGLPFTSGPIYFGAVIFLLFFIGAFYLKGSLKWWVIAGSIFTFLISLGYNLEWFNKLLFDYFPVFNKFRTPNSVLSVTAIIIPLLAAVSLDQLIKDDKVDFKKLLLPGVGLAVFSLILGLIGPGFFDMSTPADAQYAQSGFDTQILEDDRGDMMRSSCLRTFGYMMFALLGLWAYSKAYLKKEYLMIIIGLLGVVDQFFINFKYFTADDFTSQRASRSAFEQRPVDQQILQDPDIYYRVMDNTVDQRSSSAASYYHKTIGGMHAAKLQRYEDMLEYYITKGDMPVLNMLNAKYIIYSPGQGAAAQVQRNTAALGNAWFVNKVTMVDNADAEIGAMKEFDPAGEAFVHKEFADYVGGWTGSKSGTIRLTSYKPDELIYETSSDSDQFAVFSEVWYGPDKGWNAYLDGQLVDHIRANYILRAMKVPSGNHTVKFVFEPSSYKTGNLISLICSGLLLLIGAFYAWRVYKHGADKAELHRSV